MVDKIRKTAIQPNILSSNFSLFNTKLKASKSDLVWLSIYFHKRLQIPCVFFFKTPVECYPVSIRLICRAIRTTKSADKVLVPQHWIIGFWQKYSFEWRKAWIRDMSGNFWCFLCLKMSLFAQFLSSFLPRGIGVTFAFWGGLNFRVYFKSVPFLCEKCPFFSYLGCLE